MIDLDTININTLASFAGETAEYFHYSRRSNGDKFVALVDDHPEWLTGMMHIAHSDGAILPDDFIYENALSSLHIISELQEGDDIQERAFEIEADIYTHELLAWLSSNTVRLEYVDEILREYGYDTFEEGGIATVLMAAQQREKQEIFNAIVEYLVTILDDDDDDESAEA